MSNSIQVRLAPIGDAAIPSCRLAGTSEDIPVITWRGDGFFAEVEVSLGNHANPSQYLLDLAEQLAEFALEVQAAKPIPFQVVAP